MKNNPPKILSINSSGISERKEKPDTVRLGFWIFIFLLCVTHLLSNAQNKEFAEAEDLSANGRFAAALPHYLNLLKVDSSNANLNFKIGICYLNSRSQKAKAAYFLNKAVLPTTSYYTDGLEKKADVPIIAYKFLGTYRLSYNFEPTNKSFEKLKEIIFDSKDKDLSIIEVLNLKMEINKIGGELKEFDPSPVNLTIENIDHHRALSIDYSSVLLPDQSIIFSFQSPDSKKGGTDEERFLFEDITIPVALADKADSGKAIGRTDSLLIEEASISSITIHLDTVAVNNTNENEATVATSEDNQAILTYKDEEGEGNLYISKLNGNQWTAPEKLDKTLNTKGWEPNECISADGNTLYFTSNRPGGFGGMDIYKSKKLPNGKWSIATNLGSAINTPYDERAPFIYADGITLYFSSNGHKTIGSFDIFTSSLSDSITWSEPVNIGYPANKIGDDTFYPVTADTKKINSFRTPIAPSLKRKDANILKEVDNGEKDNYIVNFPNKKEIPLSLIKGKIIGTDGEIPRHIKITITDNETGEIVSIYNSNSTTGQYLFILPPGRNNNITYQSDEYLFYSENVDLSDKNKHYEINKAVQMPVITEGSKIILKNIFFDSASATLRSVSNVELNNLFHLLTMNPNLGVEISAYMISEENVKHNKNISQQRAQAVVKYLLEKGISNERITAKGYVKYKSNVSDKSTISMDTQANQWVQLNIIEKNK